MQNNQNYGATGGGTGLPNGQYYEQNGWYLVVAGGTNGQAAARNAIQGNQFGAVSGGSAVGCGQTGNYGATGSYAYKLESNSSTPLRTGSQSAVKAAQDWYGR